MDWKEKFGAIVKGIDQTELDSEQGWWETSTGAELGEAKKAELEPFIASERKTAVAEALEMVECAETVVMLKDGIQIVKSVKLSDLQKKEILAKFE